METSYDRVPYTNNPYADTHPGRARAVAWLFGLEAPPVENCRVLELGCAAGGNLLPMAHALPGGRFVGIDLSARQIEDARRSAADLGLANVEFRAMSVVDVTPALGAFDYVIAHGLYSWVPPDVQAHVLRVCRENLGPAGVAFVSFNTFPGWHQKRWLREAMLYHARQFADDAQRVRQARAFAEAVAKSPVVVSGPFGHVVRADVEDLRRRADTYVLHEFLEEHNEPVYFHEFADRAAAAGLQYLGDTRVNGTAIEDQQPEARQVLAALAGDLLRAEQYADFFRNRAFRRALLCHAGAKLDRAEAAGRIPAMSASAAVRPPAGGWPADPAGGTRFTTARDHQVTIADPMATATLAALGRAFPAAVPFDQLAADVGAAAADARGRLCGVLHQCWLLSLVELHRPPPAFAPAVSDRPRAGGYARHQVRAGVEAVTNLRHELTRLGPGLQYLLGAADGTRTVDEIAAGALAAGLVPPGTAAAPAEAVAWARRGLDDLATVALLEG